MGRKRAVFRQYQLEKYEDKHMEILKYVALGMRSKEIAARCDCTPEMVHYTKNSPKGREILSELRSFRDKDTREDIKKRFGDGLDLAIDLYLDTIQDENVKIEHRLRAADKIIKESGNTVDNDVEVTDGVLLTFQDLMNMKKKAAAVEANKKKLEQADVEEADYEVIEDGAKQ